MWSCSSKYGRYCLLQPNGRGAWRGLAARAVAGEREKKNQSAFTYYSEGNAAGTFQPRACLNKTDLVLFSRCI